MDKSPHRMSHVHGHVAILRSQRSPPSDLCLCAPSRCSPPPRCSARMCCHRPSPSGQHRQLAVSQAGRATCHHEAARRQRSQATCAGSRRECSAPKKSRTRPQTLAREEALLPVRPVLGVPLRFLTLPTVVRLRFLPNHAFSSPQALPALWLRYRFCLSSPFALHSTDLSPRGTKMDSGSGVSISSDLDDSIEAPGAVVCR